MPTTAQKTPEYDPVFYRIGTGYFHKQAYEDHIQENTGSYSGVFRVVKVRIYPVYSDENLTV